MNTTPSDTTTTKGRRSPRQRAGEPRGYAKVRTEFEDKARLWLLGRPGKQMQVPGDLSRIVALGVPCQTCGNLVYRVSGDGHTVTWKTAAAGHWASGIIATCTP